MKEIVKFEGLEITVEDGQVELTQHRNYTVNRVRIPLQLLDTVLEAIREEVANPAPVIAIVEQEAA